MMITKELVAETKHIDKLYQSIEDWLYELYTFMKPYYGPALLGNPEVDIMDRQLEMINNLWGEFEVAHEKVLKAREELKNRAQENGGEKMDIGAAVKALKEGKKVAREGWNGKGMFLWMLPAQELKMEWLHDPIKKKLAEENGGTIKANATVCLYNAQHEITTGWSTWLEDLLADDWMIVE